MSPAARPIAAPSVPRRRPRRRDAAGTREALLAAGSALFAAQGYDGVPVAAIAQRAGVNKALINYHFGGKRELYRSILEATFAEIVASVERLAASSRSAEDGLRELIAAVSEGVTRRYPHFCTLMLREVLAGGPHLDARLVAQPVRMLEAVRAIVARGVRAGEFRPVDPVLTHLSLVGSLVFFFATQRFRERVLAQRRPGARPPNAAAFVRHMQELLSHGLAAPGRAATRARGRKVRP